MNTDKRETEVSDKKILAALIFLNVLGFVGGHDFYAGYITPGAIKILIFIFLLAGYHTIIPIVFIPIVSFFAVWLLVDFILIVLGNFRDREGRPIKNWI